uniref:Uncharacterized protein n=1 Tax=Anguilla anguilla TaxID=7936 RepID=A0A0E9UEV3_ANGAN
MVKVNLLYPAKMLVLHARMYTTVQNSQCQC